MSNRIKCKECKCCLPARWIDNKRYYYCDLCRIWYSGMDKELIIVESPYVDLNKPQEIKNDNNNNATSI